MKALNNIKFSVVGGDLRFAWLAEFIYEDGYDVGVYALDRQVFDSNIKVFSSMEAAAEFSDCIILPLPLMRDGERLNAPLSSSPHKIDDIFKAIPAGKTVAAGIVTNGAVERAEAYNINIKDYLKREEFAILNAIPTAEGAIQIAMEEMLITLRGSKCLVLGNGRIGKILASSLKGLGAETTVAARKFQDFAQIYSAGHNPADISVINNILPGFDLVINTVPSLILGKKQPAKLKKDCLIIDLASKPGGIDFDAAKELSVKVIWALSLPGRVAPVTSAQIIRNTVYNILYEEGKLI